MSPPEGSMKKRRLRTSGINQKENMQLKVWNKTALSKIQEKTKSTAGTAKIIRLILTKKKMKEEIEKHKMKMRNLRIMKWKQSEKQTQAKAAKSTSCLFRQLN